MRPADVSEVLSPEERRHTLADVLARGLLRLEPQADAEEAYPSTATSQNLPEIQRDCLEVPADVRLSVPNG
jgi:hypothetical protein